MNLAEYILIHCAHILPRCSRRHRGLRGLCLVLIREPRLDVGRQRRRSTGGFVEGKDGGLRSGRRDPEGIDLVDASSEHTTTSGGSFIRGTSTSDGALSPTPTYGRRRQRTDTLASPLYQASPGRRSGLQIYGGVVCACRLPACMRGSRLAGGGAPETGRPTEGGKARPSGRRRRLGKDVHPPLQEVGQLSVMTHPLIG